MDLGHNEMQDGYSIIIPYVNMGAHIAPRLDEPEVLQQRTGPSFDVEVHIPDNDGAVIAIIQVLVTEEAFDPLDIWPYVLQGFTKLHA